MNATEELLSGMSAGREWSLMGDGDAVRTLLGRVYDERYHKASHHKDRFQVRVNLQKKEDSASYAGWITAENPTSGPYLRRRLVERLTAEISRTTGRRYKVAWEALDDESLRELQRLLRDLDQEKQMAVQQARIQPWRR